MPLGLSHRYGVVSGAVATLFLLAAASSALAQQPRVYGPEGPPRTCLAGYVADQSVGTGATLKSRDTALIRLAAWQLNPSAPGGKGALISVDSRVYDFRETTAMGRWANGQIDRYVLDAAVPERDAKPMKVGGRRLAAVVCENLLLDIELVAAAKDRRDPKFANTRLTPVPPDLGAAIVARDAAIRAATEQRRRAEDEQRRRAEAEARESGAALLAAATTALPVPPLTPGGATAPARGATATAAATSALQMVDGFTISTETLVRVRLASTPTQRQVPIRELKPSEVIAVACPTPDFDEATSVQYEVVNGLVLAIKCYLETPDDPHTTALFGVVCENDAPPIVDRDAPRKQYMDGPPVTIVACDRAYPKTVDYRAAMVAQSMSPRRELAAAKQKELEAQRDRNNLLGLGLLYLLLGGANAEPTAASCATNCQQQCAGNTFLSSPPDGPGSQAVCVIACQAGCPAR